MEKSELDKLVAERVEIAVKAATPEPVTPEPEAPAPEPVVETPAVKSYSQDEVDALVRQIAEQSADAAAKAFETRLKISQRPPVIVAAKANGPAQINRTPKYHPFYWAVKAAQMTGGRIIFNLADRDREMEFDGSFEAVKAFKAMAAASGSNVGDSFIPTILSGTAVDNLYAEDVLGNLDGVMRLPMPGLTVDMPTIGAFSAQWTAENTTITPSDASTSKRTMTAKKLTAMAKISNELLVDSNPAIEPFIQRGLRGAIGSARNIGFIRGAGGDAPTGITAGGTETAAGSDNFYDAVIQAVQRLYVAEIPADGAVRVLARPEVVSKALRTREGTDGGYLVAGAPVDKSLVTPGFSGPVSNILGIPVYQTTGIENSSGSSDILVIHAPSVVIGDRQQLEITVSKEAGTAFADDQTWIRAITRGDIEVLRSAAVQVVTDFSHT